MATDYTDTISVIIERGGFVYEFIVILCLLECITRINTNELSFVLCLMFVLQFDLSL